MSESKGEENMLITEKETDTAGLSKAPCLELRTAMEKCIADNGEEKCKEATQAYKSCMKALGLKV